MNNTPDRGRKFKPTTRADQLIVRKVKKNSRQSAPKIAAELQNELQILINPSTVRNRLKSVGAMDLHKNQRKRLKWAMDKLLWSIDDWINVFFFDETKINLFGSDGVTCEGLQNQILRPTVKHDGGM